MDDARRHATLGLDNACADFPLPLDARWRHSIAALHSLHETRCGHDRESEWTHDGIHPGPFGLIVWLAHCRAQ